MNEDRSSVSESLGSFASVSDEPGLSLNELTGSLANLLNKGSDPYREAVPPDSRERETNSEERETDTAPSGPTGVIDPCPVTPKTILESILFLGHPENEPLTATQIASLMRGVRAEEIDALVDELNETYHEEGCPYEIRSVGLGYCLLLRCEFEGIRDNFYGKVRQARLSQAAIDVLAIVAYHQPAERKWIDELRREDSGRILAQLVRRELLSVERLGGRPKKVQYRTTPRFLEFLGLESLEELPQSLDFGHS